MSSRTFGIDEYGRYVEIDGQRFFVEPYPYWWPFTPRTLWMHAVARWHIFQWHLGMYTSAIRDARPDRDGSELIEAFERGDDLSRVGKHDINSIETSDALDLDVLESLAKAATPGPWTEFDDEGEAYSRPPATGAFLVEYGADADQKMRDIRYIAAVDPQTVLALIAALHAASTAPASVGLPGNPGVTYDDIGGM